MDLTIDKNGDLDRDSFLAFVENGKQVVKETLPKMSK
jgi:branched-chain amino acid transport system substrate-binding protein